MRKTETKTKLKSNSGITLIALVITIIVLLILAGVAISMLSGENGILNQAAEAKTKTDQKTLEEQVKLAAMDALMRGSDDLTTIENDTNLSDALDSQGLKNADVNGNATEGYIVKVKGKTYKVASDGTVTEPTAIDLLPKIEAGEYASGKSKYIDSNKQVAVIPKGYTVSNVSTEKTINSGLVIYEGDLSSVTDMTESQKTNSQFVWVPVDDVTTMYEEVTLSDETKQVVGKLYKHGDINSPITFSETGYREPAVLYNEDKGVDDSAHGIELATLQSEFDEMIKYVGEAKGFYVGRYETSWNSTTNKVQSVAKVTSAEADDTNTNMWYGLYEKQKLYGNDFVGSSMIWGSQYDQMMIWMKKNDYTVESNVPKADVSRNKSRTTGGKYYPDVMNNVNDLIGCHREWILEAGWTYGRVARGGDYNASSIAPADYIAFDPSLAGADYSSRLALYVK